MSKSKTPPNRQAQRAAEAHARQVPLPDGLDPDTIAATAALFVGQYHRAERLAPRAHSQLIVRQLIRAGWLA